MRKYIPILIGLLSLFTEFPSFSQENRGRDARQLNLSLLELPAIHEGEEILIYSGFIVNYNTTRLIPNWVAYELTSEEVEGTIPRANGFSMDLNYKKKQAMREDYSNSGWDKGHMAPAADMKWSESSMYESFYLTNICPQNHDLNSRDWQALEKLCRTWARKFGKIWIVCGPVVYTNKYGKIGPQNVVVPDAFFKAILAPKGNGYNSIAFVMDNISESQSIRKSAVTVNDLELLINYDLYTNLSDRFEEKVESQMNLPDWDL